MLGKIFPQSWCEWGEWNHCSDDSCATSDPIMSKAVSKSKSNVFRCIDYMTTSEGVRLFKVGEDGSRQLFLPTRRRFRSCQCTSWNIFRTWFGRSCNASEISSECEVCDLNKYMESLNITEQRFCSEAVAGTISTQFVRVSAASIVIVAFIALLCLLLYKLSGKRSRLLIVSPSADVLSHNRTNFPPDADSQPPSYSEVVCYVPREPRESPSSLKSSIVRAHMPADPSRGSPPPKYQDLIDTSPSLLGVNCLTRSKGIPDGEEMDVEIQI